MVSESDIKKYSSPSVVKSYKRKSSGGTRARVREYSVVFDAPGSGKSGRQIIRGTRESVQREIEKRRAAEKARKQLEEKTKKILEEKAAADKLRQEMIVARRSRNKSLEAAKAVELRENLTRQARLRGRSFTKSEARQFLGGSAGVQALRAGRAAEQSYFRKTGISLSQEREKLRRQAQLMKGVQVSKILAETLPSKRDGYVRIRLPNGRIEEISKTGRTSFNKAYAGERVVINNGQVIQVGDDKTNKVKFGTIDIYTKPTTEQIKKSKEILSKEARAKVSRDFINLSNKYRKDILKLKNELKESQKKKDNWRLRDLQIKKNLTSNEIAEKARLTRITSNNYKKSSDIIAKSLFVMLVDLGYSAPLLLYQLRNDPLKTLTELPNQVLAGLRADFTRAKSEPVGLITVATEYLIAGQILTGITKTAAKPLRAVAKIRPQLIQKIKTKLKSKTVTPKSIAKDYKKSLAQARKIRQKSRQKYTTIQPKVPDYYNGIRIAESFAEATAEVKARAYIINYINKGGKITKGQADNFVNGVKNYFLDTLKQLPEYNKMQRYGDLTRNSAIKLIKQNRIKAAKYYIKKTMEKTNKLPIIKEMNKILSKVKSGIKITKRRVASKVKKTKKKVDMKKIKRKSEKQYRKELAMARKRRAQFRKKFDIIKVGNTDYIEAVAFIDDYAKLVAANRARAIVSEYTKRGLKLTKAQTEKVISLSRKQAADFLKKSNTYKQLQNAAKLNKPATIKLQKAGSIKIARVYVRELQSYLRNVKGMRQLRDVIRKTKRATSPVQIKKKVAKAKIIRDAKKRYRQTNRYLLEKNRPIRSVTIERLRRTNTVTNMNKLVDDLFDEISRRRRVDVSSLQFRQSKNILKKRLRRAINSGNRKEVELFRDWVRNTINDINNPNKQPTIKIKETAGEKAIKTIRNFKPESPRGTYREVKVGNQIQLQKVKTKSLKQGQKVMQKQKVVVKSINKPIFSMKPLAKAIGTSIGIQISKTSYVNDFKSGQTQKIVSKLGQEAKQDYKTVVAIDQGVKNNIKQAAILAQRSRYMASPKAVTTQRGKKEKIITVATPKGFTRKKLSKPTPAYRVIVKRRGKWVNLMAKPLTKKDARDYLAYSIDNGLERSAFFVPVGKAKVTAKLPVRMVNYYGKVSNKLRPYKIRAGKKKQLLDGYIEKRGAAMDTAREKAQAQRLRAQKRPSKTSSTKKKVVRKAPAKRKVVKRKPVKRKAYTQKGSTKKRTTKRKKR